MDNTNNVAQLQDVIMNINDEHCLPAMMQSCMQESLNTEFNKFIEAERYERTETRNGYRNGSYERLLITRVGSIVLQVPRDRNGNFSPQLFNRYQRSEKALVTCIVEMYFKGVSTRKVNAIVEELCGTTISKSQVSQLTAQLDEQLEQWRNRLLTDSYIYLIIDARYEKVRENGCIVNKAFVVVIGITLNGTREIIGCWVINSESYESWDECFKELKSRGLHGVEFAVTDQNKGLRTALAKHFQGIKLQRCQVHYMRNFIAKITKSEQAEAIRLLKDVFAAQTKEEANRRLETLKNHLTVLKKHTIVNWLEESVEECFTILELPYAHHKQMKSTNMLERFNQDLKRRSRVVRIFPNEESCVRLLGALCQETSEAWGSRKYINMAL